jgi:ArsR family transcriptional regulator
MMAMKLIGTITEECCPRVLQSSLEAQEAEDMAAALQVVADPTRLRLLSLLSTAEDREACVCELTEPLGLSQPTVSHHLKVLTEAGLVERQQRGKWAFFRVRSEPLELLRGALAPPG